MWLRSCGPDAGRLIRNPLTIPSTISSAYLSPCTWTHGRGKNALLWALLSIDVISVATWPCPGPCSIPTAFSREDKTQLRHTNLLISKQNNSALDTHFSTAQNTTGWRLPEKPWWQHRYERWREHVGRESRRWDYLGKGEEPTRGAEGMEDGSKEANQNKI